MCRIAGSLLLVAGLFAFAPLAVDTALAHRIKALTERQEKAVADEIKAFRAKVAETIARKGGSAIAALYADRFVHTHASGKVDDKRARVASVMVGHPVIEAAPATDLAFRVPAGWTAVVTGVSPIPGADGKTYSVRWTTVYVRGPDGWQIAASHATRLSETS